jgi:transposase
LLHIDPDTRYYWYQGATDFRKGFDGLSGLVREHMRREVTDGGVFIFVNRRRNAIKLLKWEHDGLALYHKRLERGVFEAPKPSSDGRHMRIASDQLSLILHGIRLSSVVRNRRFSMKPQGCPQGVEDARENRSSKSVREA